MIGVAVIYLYLRHIFGNNYLQNEIRILFCDDNFNSENLCMMGDFNANLKLGTNTLFGDELKRFCNEELLTISDSIFCDPNSFTTCS